MTNSKIDLCSQALVKLGAKSIASMDENTTEAMVADKPEDKCACGHNHAPDMGGMGGMY